MSLDTCKQNLNTAIQQHPELKDTVSQLTTQAWGAQKASCYTSFGGLRAVEQYVQTYQPVTQQVVTSGSTGQSGLTTGKTTTQNTPLLQQITHQLTQQISMPDWASMQSSLQGGFKVWLSFAMRTVLGLVAIVVFAKMIRYLFEFLYDVINAHRVIFLHIILPRGDDKISREQEKDVAKDMKEKISRMGQVYDALHKLGQSSFIESTLRALFHKPKVTLVLHYEHGLLHFYVSSYPEYRKVVESGIAAQFPDASIELLSKKPAYWSKKYNSITALETKKNPVFPIKTYKQMPDDPMNNIIDTMGKMSPEDTFSIVMPFKPIGEKFNKNAKKWATGLYRREKFYVDGGHHWLISTLLFPRTIIKFLVNGGKKRTAPDKASITEEGKDFVRMTKAEEEALNIMGEEAGKHAFETGILLISSSNEPDRSRANIDNMISIFTIFRDEFNNELDNNEILTDAMGWFFKPLWRFAAKFQLPHFFYKRNIMTPNALTSLYHYPNGLYNRAPIIKWLDYKMLAAPDNIAELKQPTDYIITGTVAEDYLGGNISEMFSGINNWAVGDRVEEKEEFTPYAEGDKIPEGTTIVDKDGQKKLRTVVQKKVRGLRVFKDGTLLGVNVYRNTYTPIYITKKDRSRHHYIMGKSGGGKSVFLGSLARQDIWSGEGCCVIDPHGDLVEDILQYIPKERAKDVVYFDAGNEDRPMGLNLYEIRSLDEADRVVNDATEMFLKMFGPEIFGPRIQEYFKYGSLTLLEDMEDPATLIDIPRLFTDETFRDYKVKKVKNPVVRNFWEKTYNAIGDREKQEIIPYFTSKFVSFITNSLIRNIIGQTKSAFNFRQIMDEGKILLVNLSKGKIGELNAQLLGMILVSNIYNAAMARADIEESKRKDFFLYVDEFQNFVTNTFADILSEARKYHLSLIMAHQYIAQLDGGNSNNIGESGGGKKSVKDAVFGNVGTMQSFKIGAPDAEFMEKEYAPVLSAQDIVGISNYKAYCKLNINNATSRVFSMDTIWTQDYKDAKKIDILREYSGKKYGRKKEYVEQEIQARLGMLATDEQTDTNVTPPSTTTPEAQPASVVIKDTPTPVQPQG